MLCELSAPFYPGMPRYDETIPDVAFLPQNRTPGDINNTTILHLFTHAGTHVDAPFHFDGSGRTIDQIPIERFAYARALVARVPKGPGGRISEEDLKRIPKLQEADLVLLYTGYSSRIADEARYREDFPALDLSGARYLRRECPRLQAVGIDTLSIEGADGCDHGFCVHHELLDEGNRAERSLLVYENLDLRPVEGENGFFRAWAFPLRLPGLDASPINMVAEI